MAITNTTRFGLTQWSSSGDDFTREQLTSDHDKLGDDAAIFLSGTSASPPATALGNTKAFYWDNTNGILYYRGDTVGLSTASWTQLHPVVPTAHVHADLQPLDADLTALSALSSTGIISRTGSNTYSLRSIGVSGTGLSISNGDGVSGNITITINATSNATVNTVVSRDASGNFKSAAPAANSDVTTKLYVDTADALKANAADVYTKTEMADPTVRALLNLQTLDADLTALSALTTTGIVSRTAADTYATRSLAVSGTGLSISNANGASGNPTITLNSDASATPSTVALRDGSGRIQVATPSANADATTKLYVDTADALKANTADVYSKTDIHSAKLYQYANEAGGTGTALPSSGTRTTPRIYVQSTEPSSVGAITGDIWFQI